jgi:hypothetical protein
MAKIVENREKWIKDLKRTDFTVRSPSNFIKCSVIFRTERSIELLSPQSQSTIRETSHSSRIPAYSLEADKAIRLIKQLQC